MKTIKEISENEMVATFLKGELKSNRFGHFIADKLSKDSMGSNVIESPNLEDPEENVYRNELLTAYRGFETKTEIFSNFPSDTKWEKVLLSEDDLVKVRYINYDYWVELSGGTRLAKDAAENIKKGIVISNESNDNFLKAAEALAKGVRFPEMILIGTHKGAGLIVLEGHLRLTAYMLNAGTIPKEVEAIVGYSEDFVKWDLY